MTICKIIGVLSLICTFHCFYCLKEAVYSYCLYEGSLMLTAGVPPCSSAGHVLHVLGGADENEHAARLPAHHHRRVGRPAVQLLPPLVRRHLPGERADQHRVHLPGAQTVVRAGRGRARPVAAAAAARRADGVWGRRRPATGRESRASGSGGCGAWRTQAVRASDSTIYVIPERCA